MNVKHGKWVLVLTVMAMLLCVIGAAFGETARVVTPGGALNMRKKADEKSNLVESVPNKSLVEAEEIGEEWSKIVYKKKTGYVKTEFLKLPSQLPGQTVYMDGGSALLRSAPAETAPILRPISCLSPVQVIAVEGEWANVLMDGAEGWVECGCFSFQYQEPMGEQDWMAEPGKTVSACDLLDAPGKDGRKTAALASGEPVTVTLIEKDYCLVMAEDACGWAPVSSIALIGPVDEGGTAGTVAPMEAAAAAEKALTKQFKAFGKASLYCAVQPEGNAYRCGFFTGEDQYLYGALVDAETGKAALLRDYTGFAVPPKASAVLPEGEMTVSLSAGTLAVGKCWTLPWPRGKTAKRNMPWPSMEKRSLKPALEIILPPRTGLGKRGNTCSPSP